MRDKIRVLCQAVTRSGQPCKRFALPGSDYCKRHQPVIEPVEAKAVQSETPDAETRHQLAAELDQLVERIKATTPNYAPPPFSPHALLDLIDKNLDKIKPGLRLEIAQRLQRAIGPDWFDVDTWKGVWYVINYALRDEADFIRQRVTGEYETDEWGLDQQVLERVSPFFEFMYKSYWRVQTSGLNNIPLAGRALLVVNHAGILPWDSAMVTAALYLEHPARRLVRTLYAPRFSTLPLLPDLFVKCGQVLATQDNGIRLLEQDQLVAVFPESLNDLNRLDGERYQPAHISQVEFVQMALVTGAPMIPVSVVGADESYLSLYKSPVYPWLDLLGLVPLPVKWYIDFGEPIPIPAGGDGPGAADDPMLVSQLADQVREAVQETMDVRLAQRRTILWG